MKTKVVQQENVPEVPAEIIAQSIEKVASGFDRFQKAGLSERCILALLKDATGESKETIKRILNGMADLRRLYLAKKK